MKKLLAAIACFVLPVLLGLAAAAEEKLIVLSPHWEGTRYEFEQAFKAHYLSGEGSAISFVWLDVGATSEIVRFVESEFQRKPEGIGVDVVFGGGTDPFEGFKGKNLLVAHKLPEKLLQNIPATIGGSPLYDGDYYWYAPAMSVFGVVCNDAVLRHLRLNPPRSWEDLARPEYFSWISLADPRKSGSAHMAYEIILQAYGWEQGWEILFAMAGNARSFVAHASQVGRDVADGEVACGMSIDSTARALIRTLKPDEMSFIVPDDATVINGDGLAVLKGAPNLKAATRFLEFMMSEEAQKKWLYKAGIPGGPERYTLSRFSVLPVLYLDLGEKSEIKMNPFSWKSKFQYDAGRGSARWNVLNSLIGVFLVESHRQLVDLQRRHLRSSSISKVALNDVWTAPIEEQALSELVGNFEEPLLKNQIMRDWKKKTSILFPPQRRISYWLKFVPGILALLLALRVARFF